MFKNKLKHYYDKLNDGQLDKLEAYYNLLKEHSRQYNLTAIREEDEIIIKHYYDSLVFSEVLGIEEGKNMKVLDMGTGAGFPGLVAAIMNESAEFTLVDSVGKKINFIKLVANNLGLNNVIALHARSEALGQDPIYREDFDIGIARGVAYLPVLSEYLLPLIKVGGKMIVTKECPFDKELTASKKALSILGGTLKNIMEYELPVFANKRVFLTFKKTSRTPKEYPRREGIPTKKPL